MIYGGDSNKGLRANGFGIESVTWGEGEEPPADLIVHSENNTPGYHSAIAQLGGGELPLPLGVLKLKNDQATNSKSASTAMRPLRLGILAASDVHRLRQGSHLGRWLIF